MPQRIVLAMVMLLVVPLGVRADGCKITLNGRFVPEREQRALIEWADGTETLHVAARSEATTAGTIWMVPVRAPAVAVRAEPVDEFPVVGYYETLKSRSRKRLDNWLMATAVLNTGGLLCPCFVGGCDDKKAAVKEASRIEKLGMVVTVVTTDSRTALEQYLTAQGVDRRGVDLSPLEPYLGKPEYALVCGWVARSDEPATATGLKIVFPSPTVWFPLRPTRAYASPVDTVVFVRGFVKPADGCDLPDLRCEYIYGKVEKQSVHRAFAAASLRDRVEHYYGETEPLTRVTLTTDPQKWHRDLELVQGTTLSGSANLAITGWMSRIGLVWSAILGALLGLSLPLLALPRTDRSWGDYLAGVLAGAAIALSIWASAVVFFGWRAVTARERLGPARRYLALVSLVVTHFLVVLAIHGALTKSVAGE